MIWLHPEAEKTPDFKMTGQQLAGFDAQLLSERPVITIENPFDQDDWLAWTLFAAQVDEVQKAVDVKSCNALLLK